MFLAHFGGCCPIVYSLDSGELGYCLFGLKKRSSQKKDSAQEREKERVMCFVGELDADGKGTTPLTAVVTERGK